MSDRRRAGQPASFFPTTVAAKRKRLAERLGMGSLPKQRPMYFGEAKGINLQKKKEAEALSSQKEVAVKMSARERAVLTLRKTRQLKARTDAPPSRSSSSSSSSSSSATGANQGRRRDVLKSWASSSSSSVVPIGNAKTQLAPAFTALSAGLCDQLESTKATQSMKQVWRACSPCR